MTADLIAALRERTLTKAAQEAADGQPMFMGIPDRWFDDLHFRCVNGHVSTTILKSELRGDLCLACRASAVITWPEDEEGAA